MSWYGCKKYEAFYEERNAAQIEFRNRNPRRNGQRWVPYPVDLEEVPPFAQWLQSQIATDRENGIVVPDDVEDSSKPHSLQAQRYRSMYAYGYHYRVKSAEENVNRTCDSGIAAVF